MNKFLKIITWPVRSIWWLVTFPFRLIKNKRNKKMNKEEELKMFSVNKTNEQKKPIEPGKINTQEYMHPHYNNIRLDRDDYADILYILTEHISLLWKEMNNSMEAQDIQGLKDLLIRINTINNIKQKLEEVLR